MTLEVTGEPITSKPEPPTPTPEQSTNSVFAGGDGTEQSPYQIRTLKQLQEVSQYNGCYFVQVQDIDVDYGSIEPLFPSEEKPFNGVYDGGGYTIANYNYADGNAKEVSIFGYIGKDGIIKNVTVKDSFLTAKSGAVLAYKNGGNILGCKVLNTSVRTSECSTSLICARNNGTIKDCTAEGTITYYYENDSTNVGVGGVTGWNEGNIFNCSVKGIITATKAAYGRNYIYAGGIAGINDGMLQKCSSEYIITAKDTCNEEMTRAGGVVGLNDGQTIGCSYSKTEEDITVSKGSNKGLIAGGGNGIIS